MLIELDNLLVAALPGLAEEEWDGLRNLAVAAREGKHYVIAHRKIANELSSHPKLGHREQSMYRSLGDRYATLAGLAFQVRHKVRVTTGLVISRTVSQDGIEIKLPITYFSRTDSVQRTALICEHLDDCYLIWTLTRTYARVMQLDGVRTEFDNVCGGGGSTATVARDYLERRQRLILAVADSDRKSPEGTVGSTALSLQRLFRDAEPCTAELHIILSKELENLIPDAVYRRRFSHEVDHRGSVAFLTALSDVGCDTARQFIDIKKGLRLGELFPNRCQSDDFQSVWGPVIRCISAGQLPTNPECVTCASSNRCAAPNDCTCVLMGVNKSSLLAEAREAFGRDGRELWRTMPDCVRLPISEIVRLTFDWGCATPPYAT